MEPAPYHIYLDGDACPVKEETYRVAQRHGLCVTVVANSWMRLPNLTHVHLEVVDDGFDAADDWIAERAGPGDIVVTADIPLASRCVKTGATVIGPTGHPFTEQNIGNVLATRDLMAELRDSGTIRSGPAPMSDRDRSRYLQALDAAAHAVKRQGA